MIDDYDRHEKREREARERLRSATFKLQLRPPEWGTGFFFAPDLAFTADHNVRDEGTDEFDGFFGTHRIRLKWIREWSSADADIAVLRLIDKPQGLEIGTLPAEYFDRSIPPREIEHLLRRREVAVYGFPCQDTGQAEYFFPGNVDGAQPLAWTDDKGAGGTGVARKVYRLHILGNAHGPNIPGMSGGPAYLLDWNCVIGVVAGPGGDEGPVARERHGGDPDRVAFKGAQQPTRAHVPEPHGAVPEPAACDESPVARKRHSVDRARVAFERAEQPARVPVPEPHDAVTGPAGHEGPVA
jgi:hypothetical protein